MHEAQERRDEMGWASTQDNQNSKGASRAKCSATHRDPLPPGTNQHVQGDPEFAQLLPVEQRRQDIPAASVVDQELPILTVFFQLPLASSVGSNDTAEIQVDHPREGICRWLFQHSGVASRRIERCESDEETGQGFQFKVRKSPSKHK